MMIILDMKSVMFGMTVIMITICVMFYSKSYMSSNPYQSRFYKLVLGFVLSMMIFIFSANLFCMLVGWDGLGILSFLLVVFYQNEQSLGSGLITFFTNRTGDALLLSLISLLSLNLNWGWFNYFSMLMLTILMLTAITKSAQIPFSSWLPRAMAAPTPISSLVHSSTLVTAGVFLLIRFHYNLDFSMLLILGIVTSLYSGIGGSMEHDLKKIVALSTLSQLGVMFISLGLNCPNIAFFHLLTHAYFKSMIFICAGEMIKTHQNTQDIRFLGNVLSMNQITSGFMMSGSFSLMGLPFMSGFYSKDAMLEQFMNNNLNWSLVMLSWLSIVTTSVYSTRLFMSTMWKAPTMATYFFKENQYIIIPIVMLNMGGTMMGSILSYHFYYDPFFSTLILKLMPMFCFMFGSTLIIFYYYQELKMFYWYQFGYLNPLTNLSAYFIQHQLYDKIMITEQGWMESIPNFFKNVMKYTKEMNFGLSILIAILMILY